MSRINQHLAEGTSGIENPLDFDGVATFDGAVQLLIDAISKEATDPTDHRLFLDEMSPACRDSLYVMLTALKASMANGVAGRTQVIISSGVEFASPDQSGVYVNGHTPTIVDGVVTVLAGS